jgi:hypothetical protein
MKSTLPQEIKREDIIPFLDDYYKSIGRSQVPNYREYSLAELKKCLTLFGIHLVKDYPSK